MDLDNVIKAEENQYSIQFNYLHDSNLLKIEENSEQYKQPQPPSLVPQIINYLHKYFHVIDTPIQELLEKAREIFLYYNFDIDELSGRLKKMKIMLKKERAKSRRKSKKLLEEEAKKIVCLRESDEDSKRKKNRISAQTSRDKRKEYIKGLVKENQCLKNQNNELKKENDQLRRLFDEGVFETFKQLDPSLIRQFLKSQKCQKRKKDKKMKNAEERSVEEEKMEFNI